MVKVPLKYKIRLLNGLPFFAITLITYIIIGTAWPSLIDQKSDKEYLNLFLTVGIPFVAWVVIALEGALGIIRLKLGEKIFSRNLLHSNKSQTDSEKIIYTQFKSGIIRFLYQDKKRSRIFYGIVIALNLINLTLFSFRQLSFPNPGTWMSKVAGFLFFCGMIGNLVMIWLFAPGGKLKIETHPIIRLIGELLIWGYLVSLPLTSGSFIFAWMDKYEMLGGYPFLLDIPFFTILKWVYLGGILTMAILGVIHTIKPQRILDLHGPQQPSNIFAVITIIFRVIIGTLFIILLIASFSFGNEHIIVDELMLPSSMSYLIASTGIFSCFGGVKSFSGRFFTGKVSRHLRKSVLVFGLITLTLYLLPTMSTRLYTNPSIHRQFDLNFGSDWERQIRKSSIQLTRKTPYSRFDAHFGYEIPVNAEYNVTYMTDSPRYVRDRHTGILLSEGSAKYSAVIHELHFDAYLPAGESFDVTFGDGQTAIKYPVIVMLHGYRLDRGLGNGNWTTQTLANLGYAVFDMSYGYTGMHSAPYDGERQDGYDYPDAVHQIGTFTKYLANHSDYYHADLSNSYVAGRSYGGLVALSVGWLYDTPFMGSNYSTAVNFRGILSYYPSVEVISLGPEGNFNGETLETSPLIRGTNETASPAYNPAWNWYNPLWQLNQSASGMLAPVMVIQGTHDFSIPWKSTKRFATACKSNGHLIITAYYPFGGHACDGIHWSHYGQSVAYNAERFMALCRI